MTDEPATDKATADALKRWGLAVVVYLVVLAVVTNGGKRTPPSTVGWEGPFVFYLVNLGASLAIAAAAFFILKRRQGR